MVPQPGTVAHDALKNLVMRRVQQSERQMQSRHTRWRESERAYRVFVDPDQVQEPIEPITAEAELLYPYPTSVVIPMSYAIAQTLIAYYVNLFSAQTPYIRVGNRTPESAGPAKAQELVLSYQLDYWGWVPMLYQLFLDGFRYGMGVVRTSWRFEERTQTVRGTRPHPLLGFPMPFEEQRPVVAYEGNYNEVVDPFTFRPDPRHPIACFRDGSYCGESVYRSYFDLLRKEQSGMYANVREIPKRTIDGMGARGRSGSMAGSDRDRIMQANSFFGETPDLHDAGMVLLDSMLVDLVPSELEVGESDVPERWLVVLANKTTIIRAEPYPYEHNEYFYSVLETSPDRHSLLNPGVMEMMEPVAQHVSWLYNSHLENVRKSLNNQFIVDPDKVEMDDVLNPSAGKVIRLRPSSYGTGVDGAIKQLEVSDVTGKNIQTAEVLISLLQRLSAATDAIQGETSDSRKTLGEVSMATNMAAGRLKTLARVYAAQVIQPLARQMVQNNMQFLATEQYLRLAGSLEQDYQAVGRSVQGGVMISPEDIQGLYDYPVFDGTAPLDPVRYAQVWMQVSTMALQNPAIQQQIDHMALFKQTLHSMGVTDFARFLIPQQVQVMPDQQMQQQIQQGNLIPQPGGNGLPPMAPPPQMPPLPQPGTNVQMGPV